MEAKIIQANQIEAKRIEATCDEARSIEAKCNEAESLEAKRIEEDASSQNAARDPFEATRDIQAFEAKTQYIRGNMWHMRGYT